MQLYLGSTPLCVFLSLALQNNLDDYLSEHDDTANMYDRDGFRIPLGTDVAGADTMRIQVCSVLFLGRSDACPLHLFHCRKTHHSC
jgi:hypothetical protein